MFTSCRHLGSHPDMPDSIVKGDQQRTIVTKCDSSLLGGCREDLWMCFPRVSNINFSSPWRSCRFGHRPAGRDFERGPYRDNCDEVWFQVTQYFVRRRSLNVLPHRVLFKNYQREFWKGIIQGLLWPSLVSIDQLVSAEKIFECIFHKVQC